MVSRGMLSAYFSVRGNKSIMAVFDSQVVRLDVIASRVVRLDVFSEFFQVVWSC